MVWSLFSLVQSQRFYLYPRGWPGWSPTARVERAHSDRARSASKEGTWTLPLTPFQSSSQKLPRLFYMLLDIRLQMPRSCLPIIPRVDDAVGAEDEFV